MTIGHQIVRELWRTTHGALASTLYSKISSDGPRVYYGGGEAGHGGGPRVKIGLLQEKFPEYHYGFNRVYLVSGALYLPSWALRRLNSCGVPVILNQNGVFFPAWYPQGWEQRNEELAQAMQSASYVFYQSDFCRRAANQFLGAQPKSWEILYNAVDTDFFSPARVPRPPVGPIRLLITGKLALSTASRLYTAISGLAYARQQGIECHLIVRAMMGEDVRSKARGMIDHLSLQNHVELGGGFSRADGPEIYRSADIYLMTKHNDSCPNTVLEALASGLPVLYAVSGGVPELVGNEAGFGMPVEESFTQEISPTPLQFAEGLAKICENYTIMAESARQRACTRFNLPHWFDRHNAIFKGEVR